MLNLFQHLLAFVFAKIFLNHNDTKSTKMHREKSAKELRVYRKEEAQVAVHKSLRLIFTLVKGS